MPSASYDPDAKVLRIAQWLLPGQRAFQIATQLALVSQPELLSAILATDDQLSSESRGVARIGLANYFAGAFLLPYRAIPQRRSRITVRHRSAGAPLRSRLRDGVSPALDVAATATARGAVHLRPHRQGRQHLETAVRHRISLQPGRRQLPAVGRARCLRPAGPDRHAGRPDAGRPFVFLARQDHRTRRPGLSGSAQELRHRIGLRPGARRQAGLLHRVSRCTTRAPQSRSERAARSATVRPARSARSPISASGSPSTRTPAAACRTRRLLRPC